MDSPDVNKTDETIYYYAFASKHPFVLTNYSSDGKTRALILDVESMEMREKRFNRLLQSLETFGWLQYLDVSFHRKHDDIYFEFKLKHTLLKHTPAEDLNLVLFTYSLASNRVYLKLIYRELFTTFFMHQYKDYASTEEAIKRYDRNGFNTRNFINYLEFTFAYHKREAVNAGFHYSKDSYIKLLALHQIYSLIPSSSDRASFTFITGWDKNWLPYINESALLCNLYQIFRVEMAYINNSRNNSNITTYRDSWDGKYLYTPEEVEDGLSLPHEWFMQLFPHKSISEAELLNNFK